MPWCGIVPLSSSKVVSSSAGGVPCRRSVHSASAESLPPLQDSASALSLLVATLTGAAATPANVNCGI